MSFIAGYIAGMEDSGGSATLGSAEFTANGVYTPQSVQADVDGWNQVTVNVPTGTVISWDDILQNQVTIQDITYGDYTWRLGLLMTDEMDTSQSYRGSAGTATIYEGDGTSSRTSAGTMQFEYTQAKKYYVYLLVTLYMNGEPLITWVESSFAYFEPWNHNQVYHYNYVPDAQTSPIDKRWAIDGQFVTQAEYNAAYYSATPHTDYYYIAYKAAEYDPDSLAVTASDIVATNYAETFISLNTTQGGSATYTYSFPRNLYSYTAKAWSVDWNTTPGTVALVSNDTVSATKTLNGISTTPGIGAKTWSNLSRSEYNALLADLNRNWAETTYSTQSRSVEDAIIISPTTST